MAGSLGKGGQGTIVLRQPERRVGETHHPTAACEAAERWVSPTLRLLCDLFGNSRRETSMDAKMKKVHLQFGNEMSVAYAPVQEGFERWFGPDVASDLQKFIDFIPNLRVGESFYFGFWGMRIEKIRDEFKLQEWRFERNGFVCEIGRSLCLWREQKKVLTSQGLPWTSVAMDDVLFVTPNALNPNMTSAVEGVRDVKDSTDKDSGWFLYTQNDRDLGLQFEAVPLSEVLKLFNLNILRFLALPYGWSFNIEIDGKSHVWEEGLSEGLTH